MLEGPDRPLFPEGSPHGLAWAMLQYPGARRSTAPWKRRPQRQLIEGAKGIPTKEEMQHYVVRFCHQRRIAEHLSPRGLS